MSTFYWVGGTGNWSDDDNHWATESGGSPANGNIPTQTDNVIIDANSGLSGGGTITIDMSAYMTDFTSSTGHTYFLERSSGGFRIYGSAVFESGLTFGEDSYIEVGFWGTGSHTINPNGLVLVGDAAFYGSGTYSLLSDWEGVIEDYTMIYMYNGTFDANDNNVSTYGFFMVGDSEDVCTVNMGSGTWTLRDWYVGSDEYTIVNAETSTISLVDNSEFESGGKTYYNVEAAGSDITITGSATIGTFSMNPPYNYLYIEGTATLTVDQWDVNGADGDRLVIGMEEYESDDSRGSGDVEINLYSGGTTAIGQSFTGDGGYLAYVVLFPSKTGSPTGSMVAKLYAHSGTFGTSGVPTGEPLATSRESTYLGYTSLNFPTPVLTEDGTKYVLVLEFTGGDASNYIYEDVDNTSPTHEGNLSTYNGSWSATAGACWIGFTTYSYASYNLSKSSGTVTSNFIDINFCNATGGATWNAINSVDFENNTGWNFLYQPVVNKKYALPPFDR